MNTKPFFELPILNIPGQTSILINSRLVIAVWDFHVLTAYGQTFKTTLNKTQLLNLIRAYD